MLQHDRGAWPNRLRISEDERTLLLERRGRPDPRERTFCLIDTGTRKIGVTCDHVYDEYLKARAKDGHVGAQFDGTTAYPETRLIARDPALDLATFDVPEVLVYGSEESFYRTPPEVASGQTLDARATYVIRSSECDREM